MMAWTHAAIGAAIGSQSPTKEKAFAAGMVSHGIADLVPHRDFDMKIEVPLLGFMLALIAWRFGLKSKQLWGAIGGFSPDIENGLEILGVIPEAVYPTHTKRPWFVGHGRKVKSILPQMLLILLCLYIADRHQPNDSQ
jgi:hypothetical protein